MSWTRWPLLHFLALGTLLFGVQAATTDAFRGTNPPSPDRVSADSTIPIDAERIARLREEFTARLGRAPSRSELDLRIESEIDDEILLREALARGLLERDSGVQARLIQKMQFLEAHDGLDGHADPEATGTLLRRAMELELHRDDVVVRRILVQRMRLWASQLPDSEQPDDEAIAARYVRDRERWREPDRLDGVHVFLSHDRRPDRARRDAETLLAELVLNGTTPSDAIVRGDPFPLGHRLEGRTAEDLTRRFGARFGEEAFERAERRWEGPIESAYGAHLLWIEKRRPGGIPPLEAVADRIRHTIEQERREEQRASVLRELRSRYTVVVEPLGPKASRSRSKDGV